MLAAAVAGLLGVVFLLCCALSSGSRGNGGKDAGAKKRLSSVSESEGEENGGDKSRQKPRNKSSSKASNKKVSLSPHPLLATEFKGHTGAVLSLDFDTNGKYLASCSDGKYV